MFTMSSIFSRTGRFMQLAAVAFITVASAFEYNSTPTNRRFWKRKRFEYKYPNQEYDPSKASKIKSYGETIAKISTGSGNTCTIGCGHENLMYGDRFRFEVLEMVAKRTKLTAHDGSIIRGRRFELTIPKSELENLKTLKNAWKARMKNQRTFLPIHFQNEIQFEDYTDRTWTANGGKCSTQCPKNRKCHFQTVKIETRELSHACRLTIKFKEIIPEEVAGNIGLTPVQRRSWEARRLRRGGNAVLAMNRILIGLRHRDELLRRRRAGISP